MEYMLETHYGVLNVKNNAEFKARRIVIIGCDE